MTTVPAAKLKMMQSSMRCLTFGLFALLPMIGLPFAVAALWLSGRIRLWEKQLWNPAKPYRMAGVACAAAGTIGWLIVGLLLAIQAVSNSRNGSICGCGGFMGD